jgi:hypothetical protein
MPTLCYHALNLIFLDRRRGSRSSSDGFRANRHFDHSSPGEPDMLDRSLQAEFESYRNTLSTNEARRAFDARIERLLSQHGVDYVRGYVDALKDASF